MKKPFLLLFLMMLCLATVASADNFAYSSCRACTFNADAFDWGQLGPQYTLVNSPAIVASTGGTNFALVGNTNGGQFVALVSGSAWYGNFKPGETLAWTGGPNYGYGSGGPFVLSLAIPVANIGFGIQPDVYGSFQVVVDIYDASLSYLASMSIYGNSTASLAGDNLFFGIQDTSAANIGAIVINSYAGGGQLDQNFALDAVGISYNVTPEPGSLVLLGSGLIGAAGFVRRKLGR